VLWVLGCAARQEIPLAGVVIRQEPEPLTGLDSYSDEQLFDVAKGLQDGRDDARAEAVYERMLNEFNGSGLRYQALFNMGLLHERRQDYSGAILRYQPIRTGGSIDMVDPYDRRTFVDAQFRIAVCLGKLEDWWRSVATFDEILEVPWLDEVDTMEALTGRGIALHEAGDLAGADIALSNALIYFRKTQARSPFDDKGLAAEAAYRLGEIASLRFSAIRLQFPIETLRARLETKCELLLSAQHRYLRAMRHGDRHTVALGGYRMGQLYEALYGEVVALEIPPGLTPEQAEIYQQEVRGKVKVLIEKAVRIYEQSLAVTGRQDSAAATVTAMREALLRLQLLLQAIERGQQRAA
jgi:tetratricopeptide (TPR) repeat protein